MENIKYPKKTLVSILCILEVYLLVIACSQIQGKQEIKKGLPNFIIIFTDDQGYGDLGSFGGEHVSTPYLDKMAAEGMKLNSFYVAASICTPSRAALMTGCYPKRINMAAGVFLASDQRGLHPNEITIAEVLKTKGYATGIMGKWHLGDQPEFLPTRQGFDEFFGLPYSHDIHPWHRNNKKFNFPNLPLLEGEKVIELNPDMNHLTQRITDKAVAFIEKNKDRPFFLYIPHPLPHRPVYASPEQMKFVTDSIQSVISQENGDVFYGLRDQIYPQAIGTIDDSVGEIMNALRKHKLHENTLVVFSSDNGPAIGGIGSTGPLKGRKGNTYEGGMRMASIAWWPSKIPRNSISDEVLSTMDLLPTFAHLAGADITKNRVIDGRNIWTILTNEKKESLSAKPFYYYQANELQAVRYVDWKYAKREGIHMLHNLKEDIAETKNVIDDHPDIAKQLIGYFNEFEKELGEGKSVSKKCRPAGYIENAKPLTKEK